MKKIKLTLLTLLLVLTGAYCVPVLTYAAEDPNVEYVMKFDETATGLVIQSLYSKTSEDGHIEDVMFTWNCYDYVCRTSDFNVFQNLEYNRPYGKWTLKETHIYNLSGKDITLDVIKDAYFEIPREIEIKEGQRNRFEALIRLSENKKIVNEEYNEQEKQRNADNQKQIDAWAGITDDMTDAEKEEARKKYFDKVENEDDTFAEIDDDYNPFENESPHGEDNSEESVQQVSNEKEEIKENEIKEEIATKSPHGEDNSEKSVQSEDEQKKDKNKIAYRWLKLLKNMYIYLGILSVIGLFFVFFKYVLPKIKEKNGGSEDDD